MECGNFCLNMCLNTLNNTNTKKKSVYGECICFVYFELSGGGETQGETGIWTVK